MVTNRKIVLHPLQRLFGEDFNPKLFIYTIRRSAILLILLPLMTIGIAFFYIRYTIPIYEAHCILMIKSENPAQVLNLQKGLVESNTKLWAEVEVMKSNVILNRVVKELPLCISYFKKGNIIDDELYRRSPVVIKTEIKDPVLYGIHIDFNFKDENNYYISYKTGNKTHKISQSFNKTLQTPHLKITVRLADYLQGKFDNDLINNNYYFIINTIKTESLNLRRTKNLTVKILNPDAGTIKIIYYSRHQVKAKEICNTIANEYLNYDDESKNESALNIMNFIDDQLNNVG